jgi:hypothetical protein
MAKLGKLILYIFVLLFMLKAVSASVLPILKYDLQELAIEESTDNEESDEEFEFKFLADFYSGNDDSNTDCSEDLGLSKANFKAYNVVLKPDSVLEKLRLKNAAMFELFLNREKAFIDNLAYADILPDFTIGWNYTDRTSEKQLKFLL